MWARATPTDIVRDPPLSRYPTDAHSRRLVSQFLLSYKLDPQTVLFLGYSDNWHGDERNSPGEESRTFCVKVRYAWLF